MTDDVTERGFPVATAQPVTGCADGLVVIRIDDPDGRLGRRPVVRLHQRDRTPATLDRPVLLDRRGRGRFLGWLPPTFDGAELVPDVDHRPAGSTPRLRLRRLSYFEMVVWAVVLRPRRVARVLRLLWHGNLKGAETRFVRLFDDITAPTYRDWVEVQEAEDVRAAAAITVSPTVRLLVALEPGPSEARAATLHALDGTDVPFLVVEAEHPDLWPSPAPGDVFLRLPPGVRATPGALRHLLAPFASDAPPIVVLCDEDRLDRRGRRCDPVFKPVWDPLLIAAGALPMTGALIRRDRLPRDLDLLRTPIADLVLAAVGERRDGVVHVPRVLFHLPMVQGGRASSAPERPTQAPPPPRLDPTARPAVSVVIPTRDRADLLRACVDGLLHRTDGVDLDLVIVDNGSIEPETQALFAAWADEPSIRILPSPGPFNFALLTNLGVAATRYDLLLLLNNDIEPIESGWLRAMVAEILAPNVGAVGARLLFPDGFVQHGGVVLGGTIARHAHHFTALDGGEDRGRLALRREMSSVTAACLLTRRSLWDAIGGMDEEGLAVAFNDVDYCLKLRRRGLRVVWTPEATLIHRESVSRGADDTPEKRARFRREEALMHGRWESLLADDPYGNPNEAVVGEAFLLSAKPRSLAPRRVS